MIAVNGELIAPTPATALQQLLAHTEAMGRRANSEDIPDLGFDGTSAAIAVLRQVYSQHTAEELDAFASELERLYLHGDTFQSHSAWHILWQAGADWEEDGIRYERSTEIFVRMYESFPDRTEPKAFSALHGIRITGGVDYVRNIFLTSDKPPQCTPFQWTHLAPGEEFKEVEVENPCPNKSTWCDAGYVLLTGAHDVGALYEEYDALCPVKVARDGTLLPVTTQD